MIQWEYDSVTFDKTLLIGNGHQIHRTLNQLGREGWEPYAVWENKPIVINFLFFSTTKLHGEITFYVKRPRPIARIFHSME